MTTTPPTVIPSAVPSVAPAGSDDRAVVLITGASSGIGDATARRFAARGWRVFASMRSLEKGESLRAEARQQGWDLHTPALDVTSDASVRDAVNSLLTATGGRMDVLVNNAGYYAFGPLEETTPDELRAQMETNVIGVHRVTRAVLPSMRAQRRGRVIVVGSVSGLVALPVVGPYHASKWAIEAWAETLRYEVSALGINVSLIEPGPFQTALHDNEVLSTAAKSPDSPYAGLLAAYQHQAKQQRRAKLPALVDVIERAATTPRPRLRWPVGPNSFSAAYLRRIVPDRIYEFVMRIVFRARAR
ncbi:MAG: SDR family oxidoreductase [Deltaproteobacteria bacterium]|nr:SDR family oxidoreductase [Deltaproteobacteria bacterium]